MKIALFCVKSGLSIALFYTKHLSDRLMHIQTFPKHMYHSRFEIKCIIKMFCNVYLVQNVIPHIANVCVTGYDVDGAAVFFENLLRIMDSGRLVTV